MCAKLERTIKATTTNAIYTDIYIGAYRCYAGTKDREACQLTNCYSEPDCHIFELI